METEARTVLPSFGWKPEAPLQLLADCCHPALPLAHVSLTGHLPLTHKLLTDLAGNRAAKHLSWPLL